MEEIELWGELFERSQRKTILMNEAGEKISLDTDVYGDRPVLGKIVVLPIKLAASSEFEPEVKWAGISITDSDFYNKSRLLKITGKNRVDLLRLGFDDIDSEQPGLMTFTPEQANLVWAFVDEMWDKVDLFMIHCHAGISRSAAVAKAISDDYQPEFALFYDQLYIPNPLVYKIMTETRKRSRVMM